MKKIYTLLLLSTLFLIVPTYSAEDSLPELMQKDVMLRPYVKSLITCSGLEKKGELLSAVESPKTFRRLDFTKLLHGIFGDKARIPHAHEFKNDALKDFFDPYFPKSPTTDAHLIFLANVLYDAGSRLYKKEHNSRHLELAATLGHDDAQLQMFFIDYYAGKLETAKNYLLCSGAQGNSAALLTLSKVFGGYKQIGLPKNLPMAKLLCQEAADLGNSEAVFTIEVAAFTEGTYGSEKNFQQGIRNAKQLAENGNEHVQKFLTAIMRSSGDALCEGNPSITYQDLNFLKNFLGWEDEG